MPPVEKDAIVVGAGTAGAYAAATIARAGYDVTVLERKSEDEAGHIACGDALKGADEFPDSIPKSTFEHAISNPDVDHGRFEIPQADTVVDIPVPGELAVIDRLAFGKAIIDGAQNAGATFEFDTAVTDVLQDGRQVTGVTAMQDGQPQAFEAPIVVDAAGALSLLQDKADLEETTFDTNVNYRQFTSAYREIIEVEEPVDYEDALVFKPTDRAEGYIWYFPRTGTEINAGVGFQMTAEPMQLVEALREDLESRPEFGNAKVLDKLGAAIPTRRPYDSAVAPGYLAAGDAAGHVNPTTGGGIAGAAYAGTYAGESAIDALEAGDASEDVLWEYNERIMDHFGGRYASLDVYNILTTAVEVEQLMDLLASIPAEKVSEALYAGTADFGLGLKLRTMLGSLGHWRLLYQLYQTKDVADRLLDHYETYPESPAEFAEWQRERDAIMESVYQVTGASPKY
ncbi:geranylgeranyl reductase family protein [Halodesulfurarchaeum sp. HSR-GB]|uniref:geranylgeranyl reductase family protein n=1 Tax=Halodesulfurarchaeum sp. HSR-GB TaxID=3074077 RepID=UPI002864DB63|nr:geranylgeranyl reductase family protein [Halodesulfurarchaeum sp. HSR-GB]MDR5656914.1 geranylgeranyl reductase family protein [Halodesulfurarchaeum sp. HSR-GB]